MIKIRAAIIIIGNEILSGRTQDINIKYIAEKLAAKGIELAEVSIIQDKEEKIITIVNEFRKKYDYVFTTGGIGPTHDDITSESIAKAFGVELTINSEAKEVLLGKYGEKEFTPARQKMAMTPKGAKLIKNKKTQAPGFNIENVYVMAGIPYIMQVMFEEVLPELKTNDAIKYRSFVIEAPESKIADSLTLMQNKFPEIEVGSYPYSLDEKWLVEACLRSNDNELLDKAFLALKDMLDGLKLKYQEK